MISNNMIVPKKKKSHSMKKIVIGLAGIAFMYILYLVIYSGVLPKINKAKLVGEWTGLGYTYVFTSDGQFTGEWHDDSGAEDTSAFRCGGLYKIMGNTLTLYNTVLDIDIFPSDTSEGGERVESLREALDEGTFDIRWKYKIKFSEGLLHMDGVNVHDFPRLEKKAE